VSDGLKRKEFVGLVGAAGATTALAPQIGTEPAEAVTQKPQKPIPKQQKALRGEPLAFTFLTPPERAFVEAAAERLIPADEHGPGAREAGVAYYIDQQLAGAWGTGAGQYRQGPWETGTPEQGYQLNMIPQELYRVGIAQTNAYCRNKYGKTLATLSPALQDEVLRALEAGTITLAGLPAKTFFDTLFNNTVEGFFADPLYGGNRDKVGWKAIGFPGVAAAYVGVIEKYNVRYKVAPVGIADVEQGVSADPDQHAHEDEHRQRVAMMHERTAREA
jgi:gluconate 2-dehydrogenase gamma chain